MEVGWPYPKRIELLKRLGEDKKTPKNTWPVEFQGKTLHLVIERVPIGMPKYNLKNGRTGTPQRTYLARHPKHQKDLFTYDSESDVAQHAQHEILKDLVGDKGLLAYFKSNTQKEPLYLTPTGIVLNGNRRLCAMRLLFENDRVKNAHFGDIDTVILPNSDQRSLSDLEFNLQISEDIKADYSWTAEAYMFRQRVKEFGYTDDELTKRADKSPIQIKQLFDMLDYADVYLAKRDKPEEYDLVDDKEYAFRKIVEDRKKLDGERKELFQELSFAIMDAPKGDRAYQTVQDIAKYIEPITSTLSERLGIAADHSPAGELDELLGGRPSSLGSLIKSISDPEKAESVRSIIVEVVAGRKSLDAERKKNDFVLSQVRKANTALSEALLGTDDSMNRTGVLEQLASIEALLPKMRTWASSAPKA